MYDGLVIEKFPKQNSTKNVKIGTVRVTKRRDTDDHNNFELAMIPGWHNKLMKGLMYVGEDIGPFDRKHVVLNVTGDVNSQPVDL